MSKEGLAGTLGSQHIWPLPHESALTFSVLSHAESFYWLSPDRQPDGSDGLMLDVADGIEPPWHVPSKVTLAIEHMQQEFDPSSPP